ncbi:MAG: GAF domain-containing sensor histidine kinase [Polyangiaceae bacterium]|nr:GAF domain-containing sensor histidine kinase [Polyangiaceae bacterium]
MASAAPRVMFEPVSSSFLEARLQLARLEVGDEDRLERIIERAFRLSAEQLDLERVGIWLFNESRTTLTQCLLYERSKQSITRPRIHLDTEGLPAYFAAIEEQRTLVIDDATRDPLMAPLRASYIEPFGIGSLLDAPIFRQGKLFGVVCHEHVGPPRRWQPREIDFAASVADMMALYFEEAEAAHAQKRLLIQEKELLQAERLASVGVLARHVAHDLNNAVAPILMCAAQLRTALANDARLLERVQIILDAAEHGVSLARRLLMAASGGPLATRESIEMDALLRDSTSLLEAFAGDEVELVVDAASDRACVDADPVELIRAIINLVTNARDAMPEGGRITVRTRLDLAGLRLEVSDAGHGMTAEEQGRLFQPFYTTKPGRGTGLGLAGVRNTIEAVRGKVEVTSAPGEGTTIAITFPVSRCADDM